MAPGGTADDESKVSASAEVFTYASSEGEPPGAVPLYQAAKLAAAVARPVGRRDQAQSGELVYVTPP